MLHRTIKHRTVVPLYQSSKNVPSVPWNTNSYQTRSTTLRSHSGVESYLFLSFIIAVHFHFAIKSFKHSKNVNLFPKISIYGIIHRNGPSRAMADGQETNLFKFLDEETFEEAVGLKIICQLTLFGELILTVSDCGVSLQSALLWRFARLIWISNWGLMSRKIPTTTDFDDKIILPRSEFQSFTWVMWHDIAFFKFEKSWRQKN